MKQSAQILGNTRSSAHHRGKSPLIRSGARVCALVCSLWLTGCGLKGPLYLPASTTPSPSAASAPTAP